MLERCNVESGRLERCYYYYLCLCYLRFTPFTPHAPFYRFYLNQVDVPSVAAGPEINVNKRCVRCQSYYRTLPEKKNGKKAVKAV